METTPPIRMALVILAVFLGFGANSDTPCPESKGPMVRIGDSRYYIFHDLLNRSYNHDFLSARKLCGSIPNFRMAQIRNFTTFHFVGRLLEAWVDKYRVKDTWYWLDSQYGARSYMWGDNYRDTLKFTNFFYRYPRPTGVGSHVDYHDDYLKNSTISQCLTFALPLPRRKSKMRGAMVLGFSTTFDERPCEGSSKRHVICESILPECKSKIRDPFYLTENKTDYFDNGNWIIGDRRYIVNWKQRSMLESSLYCTSMNLQHLEPNLTDNALIPHLKLWSRNVTVSHFWTSWRYRIRNGSATFRTKYDKEVSSQRSFIKYNNQEKGRTDKNSNNFCVGMQLSYEFKHQLPCSFTDKACAWSFIEHVPTNCNNYFGTICQPRDYQKLSMVWNEAYITSPDKLINDPMQATIEFYYKGNTVRRSRFKQTFGSLVCPPNYKMVRATDKTWHRYGGKAVGDSYPYDFSESYWVVDSEYFNKKASDTCTVSVVNDFAYRTRKLQKVSCTEWHFYVCKLQPVEVKMPNVTLNYELPKSQGWNWNRHARIYPIVSVDSGQSWPTDEEDTCSFIAEPIRVQVVFCFEQTQRVLRFSFFDDFQNIAALLTTELEKQFPGSEFGVTSFAAYPALETPRAEVEDNTRKNTTACYLFHQSLTTDQNLFKQKINVSGVFQTDSYDGESSLAGVMFTALDDRMGWVNGERDDNGVLVKKVIVFITTEPYSSYLYRPNPARHPAKGDGTDTCTNALPPKINVITDVLKRKEVLLFGFYFRILSSARLKEYQRLLGDSGVSYKGYSLDPSNFTLIGEDVVKSIKQGPVCVFADPPAYNTLGL